MANLLAASAVHGLTDPHRLKTFHAFQALYDTRRSGDDSNGHTKLGGFHAPHNEEYFSENIQFRDPLMHVRGLNDYKCQFAALHSMFKNIHLEVISVSIGSGQPGFTEPGQKFNHLASTESREVLLIDANCTYEINSFLKVTIRQMTRLGLDKNGLIDTHEDLWSVADLIAGLPLLGRVYRGAQSIAGRLVSMGINGFFAFRAGAPIRQAQLNTPTLHAVYHPVASQQVALQETITEPTNAQGEKIGATSGSNKKSASEQKRQAANEQKARK